MEIIETRRLYLRKWSEKDLRHWTAIIHDPRVMEYSIQLGDKSSAKAFIESSNDSIEQEGFGFFACEVKKTEKLVGFAGLNIPKFEAHFTPCIELSWLFAYQTWGEGYALEAAKACIEYGFNDCNIAEIVAFTPEKNRNMRRVFKNLGMNFDPKDNFHHPDFPKDHPLSLHVLYKINDE